MASTTKRTTAELTGMPPPPAHIMEPYAMTSLPIEAFMLPILAGSAADVLRVYGRSKRDRKAARKLLVANKVYRRPGEAAQCRAPALWCLEEAARARCSQFNSMRYWAKPSIYEARGYRQRSAFMGFKLP